MNDDMHDDGRRVQLRLRQPLGDDLLKVAGAEALQMYHDYLGVEHLLMALSRCEGGHTERMLEHLRLEPAILRAKLRAHAGQNASEAFSGSIAPTPRLRHALAQAQERAGDAELGEQALLLAMLESGPGLAVRTLTEEGAEIEELIAAVRADAGPEATEALRGSSGQRERRHYPPDDEENDDEQVRPATGRGTSFLNRYGRDLTALAAAGKLRTVIQRKEYFAEIARALARQDKNAPVLVGEAGVGKTAIVEGLAQRLVDTARPVVAPLQDKRIVQIEVAALVAGASARGDFEERMRALLRECADHPEVILFIDEVHTLVGAGHSSGNQDAAQLIKPALERGELRLIGATTSAEYQRYIAGDAALDRRFQAIPIAEPSPDATEALVREMLPSIEARTSTRIEPEAVVKAIELSVRYIHDQRLPGKAISVLYDACSRVIVPSTGISLRGDLVPDGLDGGAAVVTPELVEDAVSHRVGFPISQTEARLRERLLDLEDKLGQRVVAQDEALAVVAKAVRAGYASIRDPNRPKATLLFTGPSGVGKTETARALAETLFGAAASQQLLTLDMSLFSEKHLLAQLIGSPPGYVDSDQEGKLTGWLRLHPFGIVLFDEIEKAHAEVRRALLGLFEEGRLVDAHGRVIWGREAIYIMTANLLNEAAEASDSDAEEQLPADHPSYDGATGAAALALEQITRSRLASALSPEFVGRIDRVVVYKPLTHEAMREIIQQKLDRIRDRLRPQRVELGVAPEVYDWLAQHGVSATTGARHLDTLIQREIAEPIATLEFSGRLTPGAQLQATLEGAHPQVAIIPER